MTSPAEARSHMEIGHVLFMDVVGYSKLLMNEQREIQEQLTQIVRATEQFRIADAAGKLIRLPTGDGMALVFFNSPEAPVQCALEISEALQAYPHLKLRMGIHSGPVSGVTDVNERSNIAGAGINTAQRVMDCGDAGHILLSKRAADDLAQDGEWRSQLHELGDCLVKHGVSLSIVNLYTSGLGNPELPAKLKLSRKQATTSKVRRKGLFLGVGILLAALFAVFIYKLQPSRYSTARDVSEKSIAVLPLENLSEEKENAYFADGIQDELLADLSKIRDLKVISRTSVMQYKTGITRNLKEIGQQLGVTAIVEGSVRRAGNRVRVTVQLIDALTDRHLWVQNYDRTLADSLALEGELATEIAAGVGATLSPQEKARVEATPTKNAAAYDAYLRGRAIASDQRTDRAKVESATKSFEEAVKLDPSFARAWASLSIAYGDAYWLGFDSTSARQAAAREALDRAIALDANLPEAHLAIGYYHYHCERDFTAALTEFKGAEQGLPNNVDVLTAIGLINRRLSHWEEAIANLHHAVELDPRNVQVALILGTTCNAARHFPEAIAAADHILAWEPTNSEALAKKITAYWATGNLDAAESVLANSAVYPMDRGIHALFRRRYAAAIEIFSKEAVSDPDELFVSLSLGLSQQRAGDIVAARATYQRMREVLQRALAKAPMDRFSEAALHSFAGVVAAALGDTSTAIAEGEKGIAMRPASEDPFEGPGYEEDMARIYAILGDADRAVSILKRLLETRYSGSTGTAITPALLQIDPVWDPIRNDARFQDLLGTKAP